ncbi:MAG: hypothetical protein ACRCX8_18815 [Sarcina sp.]
MGKKFKKPDVTCPACGKGYVLEELREKLYTEQTTVGEVIFCSNPKCNYQWINKK